MSTLVIYSLKSTIKHHLGNEVQSSMLKVKFLSLWFDQLFKLVYSITNNKSYFSITNKFDIKQLFMVQVLGPLADSYPYLKLTLKKSGIKTSYWYQKGNLNVEGEIKNLLNLNLPLIYKPEN